MNAYWEAWHEDGSHVAICDDLADGYAVTVDGEEIAVWQQYASAVVHAHGVLNGPGFRIKEDA